jgi:hypothetical protein
VETLRASSLYEDSDAALVAPAPCGETPAFATDNADSNGRHSKFLPFSRLTAYPAALMESLRSSRDFLRTDSLCFRLWGQSVAAMRWLLYG